MMNNSQV